MAYEKQEWKTGDTITAEKLNHIEDGIDKAQNRYEINEVRELLFEGSLTTEIEEGSAAYTEFEPISPINANEIIVTFNDIEYIVQKDENYSCYGEFDGQDIDYTTFPFFIGVPSYNVTHYYLYTSEPGTYPIKIESQETEIEISDDFKEAVEACSPIFTVTITDSNNNYTSDKTYNEIEQAFLAGKLVRAILDRVTYYLVTCDTAQGSDYVGAQFRTFSYFEDSFEGETSDWNGILFVTTSNQVVVKKIKR